MFPSSWTWKITVANNGATDCSFFDTQAILFDNLPNTNISYGSPSVSNAVNVNGTINCSIAEAISPAQLPDRDDCAAVLSTSQLQQHRRRLGRMRTRARVGTVR
jgi:hypothetical protein